MFTHCVAGFACLYIGFARLFTLDKKTLLINLCILFVFSCLAWIAATYLPQNYMFLKRDDGTPFKIFYTLFKGHKVWYPLSVIFTQLGFEAAFYGVANLIRNVLKKRKNKSI